MGVFILASRVLAVRTEARDRRRADDRAEEPVPLPVHVTQSDRRPDPEPDAAHGSMPLRTPDTAAKAIKEHPDSVAGQSSTPIIHLTDLSDTSCGAPITRGMV
ncbi:hypothetical protein [Lentzea cavernae]|uniref:Uncharacterized protein n=1 Tax=Lentzea cavernae TaxID=2020703 RepID=A0ABQ3M1I2_9PSEU|nr:hypothetical protein [Lentzea cavernae]GHH30481.1 hypothetical protein GCM10017774_08220 [Lentzea cavernae]